MFHVQGGAGESRRERERVPEALRQRRSAAADPDEAAVREEEPEVGPVNLAAPKKAGGLPEEAEEFGGKRIPAEADPEDAWQSSGEDCCWKIIINSCVTWVLKEIWNGGSNV